MLKAQVNSFGACRRHIPDPNWLNRAQHPLCWCWLPQPSLAVRRTWRSRYVSWLLCWHASAFSCIDARQSRCCRHASDALCALCSSALRCTHAACFAVCFASNPNPFLLLMQATFSKRSQAQQESSPPLLVLMPSAAPCSLQASAKQARLMSALLACNCFSLD